MESHEHMDKHLKQSLDDFSVQPKISSFDEILRKLEQKKKRRVFWFLLPGLLFLAVLVVLLRPGNEESISEKTGNSNISTGALPVRVPSYAGRSRTVPGTSLLRNKNTRNIEKQEMETASNPYKNESPSHTGKTLDNDHTKGNTAPVTSSIVSADSVLSGITVMVNKVDSLPAFFTDYLQPIQMLLPITDTSGVLLALQPAGPDPDSPEKGPAKKHVKFILGLHADPQFTSLHLMENRHRSQEYNEFSGKMLSDFYLENRKDQNSFKFNYAWGAKGGLIIRERWEIMAGFGFQRFKYEEKIPELSSSGLVTYSGNSPTGISTAGNNKTDSRYASGINAFKYFDCSLEAARYFNLNRFVKMKCGAGIHANILRYANTLVVDGVDQYGYYYGRSKPFARSAYVVHVKTGFINDLGKKAQIQFCPLFFYSLSSMFDKTYIIKQRPFGLSLECLLLFRIGKL